MIPYNTPISGPMERSCAPRTALTPKIVAHGSQSNIRVLKGNPVGYAQHPDGSWNPYFSARMEHSHEPIEHAMLQSVDVDHYRFGQNVPSRATPVRNKVITPSETPWHEWPDTSVSSAFNDDYFGYGPTSSAAFGPADPYTPRGGQG